MRDSEEMRLAAGHYEYSVLLQFITQNIGILMYKETRYGIGGIMCRYLPTVFGAKTAEIKSLFTGSGNDITNTLLQVAVHTFIDLHEQSGCGTEWSLTALQVLEVVLIIQIVVVIVLLLK